MKSFFKTVSLILLVLFSFSEQKRNNYKSTFDSGNPRIKKIMTEMGLEGKEILTKEEVKVLLIKLLNKDETSNQVVQFNEGVINSFLVSIPEEIPIKDFNNYINYDAFLEAIRNTIREQFGQQYVDEVMNAIVNIDDEEDEDKGQSTTNEENKKTEKKEEKIEEL